MSVINRVKQKLSSIATWIPHKYQKKVFYNILANPFYAIFLDPGLGKTSITLRAITTLLRSGENKGVLLVAPLRVCYLVWPYEIIKWKNFNSLTSTILHGSSKELNLSKKKDIYLINPEGLPWLYQELYEMVKAGKPIPFDILWIDESTKFKSPTAKTRFKLIKDLIPLFKRRYIMTGTPAPRSMMDLWSQIFIVDGGEALGNNFYKFRNKYFYTESWNKYKWIMKEGAKEEIEEKIKHLVIDMKAEDYIDLPEFIENDIMVELPAKAMKIYKQFENEMLLEFEDGVVSAEQMAQLSMKCHQMANGCVYEDIPDLLTEEELKRFKRNRKSIFIHDAKLEALQDLIDELNGKPLLIAYNFKHDLEALKRVLGESLPVIGSGVAVDQLKAVEDAWNKGEIAVLAAQPLAMAHGLNLQHGGADICWYSMTYNLEDYIQYNKRLHRQGSKNSHVKVHRLISKGTVDEVISSTLKQKGDTQDSFRDAMRLYVKNKLSSK